MRSVSLTTLPSGSFAFRSAGRSSSRFGMLMVGRGGLGGGLGEGRVSYFGYSAKDDLESLGRGTRFHEILTDDRTPALALWRRSGEPGRRPPEMHPTLRQRRSLDDDRVGSRRKGPRRVRLHDVDARLARGVRTHAPRGAAIRCGQMRRRAHDVVRERKRVLRPASREP